MNDLLFIFASACVINNFTLAYFLGLCPFFGVTGRLDTALRLGFATIFVMLITSVASWALNVYAGLALLYLFLPILWIVAFSFNQPKGKFNIVWQEFTLDNWREPLKARHNPTHTGGTMGVLVGRKAPDFTAPAVLGNGEIVGEYTLSKATEGKYTVLFFYPLDFTFVCPSELIAFDHRIEEFKKRGVEVIGVSIDSHFTHNAWRNTDIDKGGIGQVKYTLVADMTHEICRAYDVELPDGSVAFRGSFLIDKEGTVQHQVVNNLPLGRNVDEMLRMVDALQFHESYGEVCPAGWNKGDQGMKASTEGVAEYLATNADKL